MSLMIYDGMVEFSHNTMPQMNEAVTGKTIERVDLDDNGMDSFLVFTFADGTRLRIRYDWIYEWRVARAEHEIDTEDKPITVYTLPVYDEDGEITGKRGALIVASKGIELVDDVECLVGQALRYVSTASELPEVRRHNLKTNVTERYTKHRVVYGFHPVTGEAYPPSFDVWQRVE